MSLTEELARVRIAEARQEADQVARMSRLLVESGKTQRRQHDFRSNVLSALRRAKALLGLRQRSYGSLNNGRSAATD